MSPALGSLTGQAESSFISRMSDVSSPDRVSRALLPSPTRHVRRVRKEKGSLERVGSYCRYKQSGRGGKTRRHRRGGRRGFVCVCVCVYPPFHGAWSTRRRYNLKLCAQKHVTISRLRGTCSVYVRLLSLSLPLPNSPSFSLLVREEDGYGQGERRFSPRSFSRVFGFVGFVRFLPPTIPTTPSSSPRPPPPLSFCGLPRVCDIQFRFRANISSAFCTFTKGV